MKGFKPTGYGPSAGFKFPTRMGFTGSTGKFTTVAPYTRRKFADGGFVRQDNPRMQTGTLDEGSALVRRARATNDLDQESGGKTPIRPGFKNGGRNWIAGATKNKGALHRALNVPAGEKIPAKKLATAAHSDNPTMRKRAALAKTLGRMQKADGGDVRLPRRKTPYTFGQSVRAVPGFIGLIPSMVKDAVNRKITDTQQEVADAKRRRIDSIVDADAGNYARGGKMKRMGYAQGGLARMMGDVMRRQAAARAGATPMAGRMAPTPMGPRDSQGVPLSMYNSPPPAVATAPPRVQLGSAPLPPMYRAKGGAARKRMGYADGGGRRDGLVTERPRGMGPISEKEYKLMQAPRVRGEGPMSDKERKLMQMPAATIKNKFYAKGGGVSAGQAKRIAERTVGEHVRYPAPKGHKGLEKAMRR
jgi:hypothetical protein